jgi:hypothetical protein
MKDIHFISLFCTDFDQPIMEQWAKNIKSYNFKTYSVVLNSPSNDGVLMGYCASYLNHQGFSVSIDGRKFDNIRLRVQVLDAFRTKMLTHYPDDYMCVCDSDELPIFPHDISQMLGMASKVYFVKGELVDRWNDTLYEGNTDVDLFRRFPYEGNFEKKIKDNAPKELQQYFFEMCRNKYLIFPLCAQMDMTGCHIVHSTGTLQCAPTTMGNIWPVKYKIMHFTWREGILQRMALKSFNHPLKIQAVANYFGEKYERSNY